MQISDELKRLEEKDRQKPKTILRLPCGHASITLSKPEDRYLVCPTCLKKFVLHWSLQPKVTWET